MYSQSCTTAASFDVPPVSQYTSGSRGTKVGDIPARQNEYLAGDIRLIHKRPHDPPPAVIAASGVFHHHGDQSHDRAQQRARDAKKGVVMKAIDVRFVRLDVRRYPSESDVRASVLNAAGNTTDLKSAA
ncbi:hypothetical protein [Pandoraea sp. NPDC087047]|uniref:hypothetical protein n=1 Tax=Pandoraea sp. NPDC087047 TaxID=3364390 RepID=UPI0038208127